MAGPRQGAGLDLTPGLRAIGRSTEQNEIVTRDRAIAGGSVVPPGMEAAAGRRHGLAGAWSEEADGGGPRSPATAGRDEDTTADSPKAAKE